MARRRKRRLRRLILWAALALLIAGFIARRTFAPRALYYLTHRAPSETGFGAAAGAPNTAPSESANQTAESTNQTAQSLPAPSNQNVSDAPTSQSQAGQAPPPRENLTDSDRQALDQILRNKSK